MSAGAGTTAPKDTEGPIRPSRGGPLHKVPEGFATFFASRWWQLEALYRSDAKYRPEWYPRFNCHGETAVLARMGPASGIAEGFVSVPSPRTLGSRGRERNGPQSATTEGLPSLSALGLDGGDGTATADPTAGLPEQVRIRHHKLDRLRAAPAS